MKPVQTAVRLGKTGQETIWLGTLMGRLTAFRVDTGNRPLVTSQKAKKRKKS